jgi:glycine oxidase
VTKPDVLIVGQGLAGTLLAFSLKKRGLAVQVIDNGHRSAASMVAAGMWNPVSFRTLSKTWRADEFLPKALSLYAELEHFCGEQFVHPMELLRVFSSETEWHQWQKALDKGDNQYLSPGPTDEPEIHTPFGSGIVTGAGWVDLPLMLHSFRKKLEESGEIETREIHNVEELAERAEKVIFCTGYRGTEVDDFSQLPLLPNKGEVLTAILSGIPDNRIVNNGKFFLPTHSGLWRIGSTYGWNQSDTKTSDEARAELIGYVQLWTDIAPTISEHVAGIRPTVKDRRPLVGFHPEKKNIGIFNGMGTRGVLICPAMAEMLANHIINGTPIDPEADIRRFVKA